MRRLLLGVAALYALACAPPPVEEPEPAVQEPFSDGQAAVTLTAAKDRITAADTLQLRLAVVADEGVEVILPEQPAASDFLLLMTETASPRLLDSGRVVFERTYELEAFTAGSLELPPFAVRYIDGKNEGEIQTDPVPITVESVVAGDPGEAQLRDISPPVGIAPRIWPWLLGAAVLAALIWFVAKRARRRRARPTARLKPPHERAFEALAALLERGDLEQARWKIFYGDLSAILRRYIEERFGLHAPERTTEEFLLEVRDSRELNAEQKDLLRRFLERCDLVKFAEATPSRVEADESVQLCRRFIEQTQRPAIVDKTSAPSPAPKAAQAAPVK